FGIMAYSVAGLLLSLFCLFLGKGSDTKIEGSQGAIPKTYKGTSSKPNWTNHLEPSSLPGLVVDSEEAVKAYTTGALSTWAIPSAYILAMLLGVPSNAYILAFLRRRVKSFSTGGFYLNLAFSDLLFLLSLPLRVHYHFNGHNWTFGEITCRILTALFYGNVYCSAQSIACISLSRYLAVVRPFLYRRLAKTTVTAWTCLTVWLLFGAATVPELLVRQSYQVPQLNITTCHDVLPFEERSHSALWPYRLILVCLGFVVPFLICIYAHVAVVCRLRQSDCDWRPFIRVSTMTFIIFVVCFLPSSILHLTHYICVFANGDDRLYGYYRAAVCLCCFHSCLDPFFCILISKTTAELSRLVY
uniref:Coagulation factor II thrombin receptor like 2 n=1 Tax=Takifugu rubripes TaxID=31033 RepID=H2SV07_TAKRU